MSAKNIESGSTGGLEVSLSHDDDIILCVAGTGPQGCDLVAPIHREANQWLAMLGERHFGLAKQFAARGETLDGAAGRVWAAMEAAMKGFDTRSVRLELQDVDGDAAVFRASDGARSLRVLTFPKRLTRGARMVAVVAGAIDGVDPLEKSATVGGANDRSSARGETWSEWLSMGGNPADFYGLRVELDSPVDRRIRFRFPLGFKDAANVDRTLYFVRFFEWMGRLREMALRPVLARLSSEFASGQTAWVTNRSWAFVEAPIVGGEVMEVSCRFLERSGPGDATVDVGFEWQRVRENGSLERVAVTQIQVTWTRVLSHGVVAPEPYPSYLDRFFRELTPARGVAVEDARKRNAEAIALIGPAVWRSSPGPASGVLLAEQTSATSMVDANLVGNVYYSKYYELQGTLRDGYFFGVVPEAYRGTGDGGGLRCVFTEVVHLRDAMPFDTIVSRMRLVAVHEAGVELAFDYFRGGESGARDKLAGGTQIAAWMKTADGGRTRAAAPLPTHLLENLVARAAPERRSRTTDSAS